MKTYEDLVSQICATNDIQSIIMTIYMYILNISEMIETTAKMLDDDYHNGFYIIVSMIMRMM